MQPATNKASEIIEHNSLKAIHAKSAEKLENKAQQNRAGHREYKI